MKKAICIFLLAYYCFGTWCLPQGNFSALTELPKMYQHCKATEDKDLPVFDFVTDHLIDMDYLFDTHDNNNEEKEHVPFPFHHQQAQNYFLSKEFKINGNNISFIQPQMSIYQEHIYRSNYLSVVLRPPIV